MTSGKRTPEALRVTIRRYASQRNADGGWLLTYRDIAARLGIHDVRIVADAVRMGNANWSAVETRRDYEDTP